jgi:hypothetical protein
MKLPYLFLSDKHWWEDCLHVLVGLVPFWGWWREHRQFPPGDTIWLKVNAGPPPHYVGRSTPSEGAFPYAPHDRVMDLMRDNLGYAIGETLRTVALVGVIVWLTVGM